MPTLYEVKTQIRSLEGTDKSIYSKEIKELPNFLEDDEAVENFTKCSCGQRKGILVTTNRRLIFIHKGVLFGFSIKDFTYDQLTSVQYKLNSTFGTIEILIYDNRMEIQKIDKEQAIALSKYIREKITWSKNNYSKNTGNKLNKPLSIADQIKKTSRS